MDAHQTGKVADWYGIPEGKRTRWQRLAARSYGILTPGNVVSLIGAALVTLGFVWIYQGRLWNGLAAVGIGRLCDLLDGYVAHHTGTKSSLGETVDAGFDKVAVLVAFLAFASTDIVPLWLVGALALQQMIAAAASGYARLCSIEMHPSNLGKYAAAAQWISLMLYVGVAAIDRSLLDGAAGVLLALVLLGAIIGGVMATWGYIKHVVRVSRS